MGWCVCDLHSGGGLLERQLIPLRIIIQLRREKCGAHHKLPHASQLNEINNILGRDMFSLC